MFSDLKQALLDRRDELDVSQIDVWKSGGPSNTTLTKIESWEPGDPEPSLSRATYRNLDKGLRWEPGSARALVRDGTPPVPLVASADNARQSAILREHIEAAGVDEATRSRLLDVLDERGA